VKTVLAGTGSYLPARVVENRDLETFLDTTDAWIRERTGIGARRIAADDEVTSDLAAHAARRALEAAGRDPSEVDLLIVATVTPDSPMPACAVRVQQKLGISTRAPAFDLSAACAGFLFGLTIADQFIRAGTAKTVVVVGVELLSRIIDWTDRTTAVLFGDGAGAVVLERAEDDEPRGLEVARIHTDGSLADALAIPAGGSAEPVTAEGLRLGRNKVQMIGQDVFRAAVRGLGDVAEEVLGERGLTAADIDAFVFHQANIRILDAVIERLGVPRDKLVLVLERTGNTSSASIPIALDLALREGRIKRGQRVLLAALGAGVSWGGALVRL
jgi:3-oxoacyl-[acyl-carrier-protein] synthase-3